MDENECIKRTAIFIQLYDFSKITSKLIDFFGVSSPDSLLTVTKIELAITKADTLFQLNVIPEDKWPYGQNIQAYYLHSETLHEIGIQESVYNRACNGDLNALSSFLHEACHWVAINILYLSVTDEYFKQFHENIVDLLTAMLMLHKTELAEKSASIIDSIKSCPISLALFYCKHHRLFEHNFNVNILPKLEKMAAKHFNIKGVG
ncbi:MAG: hypothetical protein PUF61_04555 [Spirochaetales bacterium]|nr:hypothetical protein [Spirochaetales bacterium]